MADFRENIDLFEVTDRNHATVFNEVLEQIIGNTLNNKERLDLLPDDFAAVYTKFEEYTTTEDLNELLQHGVKGDTGDTGVGLEYNWDGTSLGIKREDETDYSYVDLQGPSGSAGLEEAEVQTMINQAVDSIVVPTKTSELVNDSNFITGDDIPDPVDVSKKAEFVTTYYNIADSTIIDNMLDSFALVAINSTSHSTLHSILGGSFTYIHTYFYSKKDISVNRYQIARAYTGSALATRHYVNGTWSEWARIPIGIINNLTSTSTTTPVSAYQAKILNDKIESLKTISVDGKQKVADVINGKLGTTLSSTTSYTDLAYYATMLGNAMNSSTPTAKFVYGTTTKTMTVTALILQTYDNAIDTWKITANSGELSGTVTTHIFSQSNCTTRVVNLSGTSYDITTAGVLYIVQFKNRTKITLTSKNGVLSAIGY